VHLFSFLLKNFLLKKTPTPKMKVNFWLKARARAQVVSNGELEILLAAETDATPACSFDQSGLRSLVAKALVFFDVPVSLDDVMQGASDWPAFKHRPRVPQKTFGQL
jgi:hypothetical protein